MKKFRIKKDKSFQEREALKLKEIIEIREIINLEIYYNSNPLNDVDTKTEEERGSRIWYIDVNDISYPKRFIDMHYEEVDDKDE